MTNFGWAVDFNTGHWSVTGLGINLWDFPMTTGNNKMTTK